MTGLTEAQVKALRILVAVDEIRPREFARKMWPDSPGWKHSHKCGPSGASRGAMMPMVGGGYLGKLTRMDPPLACSLFRSRRWPFARTSAYVVSKQGREALTEYEREKENGETGAVEGSDK